jgi:hypothetical protein
VRNLQLAHEAADDERLLAPVELEGFAELELERHERRLARLTAVLAPAADKLGHPCVAARETLLLQLPEQH